MGIENGYNYTHQIHYLEEVCFNEEAWTLKQIEEHCKQHPSYVYLTHNVVGYMLVLETNYELELLRVGVHPQHRKQGIANLLLQELLKIPKDIFLEVKNSNLSAIHLYEANQFCKISERKNYYPDGNTAYIYAKYKQ